MTKRLLIVVFILSVFTNLSISIVSAQSEVTPDPNRPRIAELYFSTHPNVWSMEPHFPLGTEEVTAVMRYINMRPDTVMKRAWYVNGEVWVEREEVWDYDQFGSSGWRRDISIFDHIDGLPTGVWELEIMLDGVYAIAEEGQHSFTIALKREWQQTSWDGKQLAWVENERDLVVNHAIITSITDPNSRMGDFDWHPDNQHILYTEIIRPSEAMDGPPGPRYRLWGVDTVTGESWVVADADRYVSTPRIAPDGKTVALVFGNGYGDACFAGLGMGFHALSADLELGETQYIYSFDGYPERTFEDVYPVSRGDFAQPGYWEDATHFVSALQFTCVPEDAGLVGIYRLDVPAETVERIGDLPES